ncbi:LacI family DNA-binding transcriptional regulator [Rhizobium sp. NPDC090275]|uniref:LacI family DNA-binding transcriptional regulator n=1 Tax=Rhizobium sp. NPDC090275 TaxID=3364498 RepID=UPI00383A3DDA
MTFRDIAKEANVGTATVERVINGRGGVSDETAAKVVGAAARLGYGSRNLRLHHGSVRIEVILPRPDNSFFARLNRSYERIAQTLDRSITLHRTFVNENDPVMIANHIANPMFRRAGLIICARDDPRITQSLTSAKELGVEIVQVVTQCDDGTIPYVGVDNYSMGRSAGHYLALLLTGREGSVVSVCHSTSYRNQRERVQGFSDYLAENSTETLNFSHVMLGRDDDLLSAELFAEAVSRDSNIIGIYTAGGGDEGIGMFLQKRQGPRRPIWIGQDLTDKKVRYLKAGVLDLCLDLPPQAHAQRSVDLILSRLHIIDAEVSNDPLRFFTVSSQNAE